MSDPIYTDDDQQDGDDVQDRSHFRCLGCGDSLPAWRGGHCQACVEWEPPRARVNWNSGPCLNCGGAHHIQKCGEILAALAIPDGTPADNFDDVPAGDGEPSRAPLPATARQWLTEDWRRDALARRWSAGLLEGARR